MIKHKGIKVSVWSIDLQLLGRMMPKIRITSKKSSNKSCSELNFVQKSTRALMSIFPCSGASALERLACSKYYSVGKMLPKIHVASKKA